MGKAKSQSIDLQRIGFLFSGASRIVRRGELMLDCNYSFFNYRGKHILKNTNTNFKHNSSEVDDLIKGVIYN